MGQSTLANLAATAELRWNISRTGKFGYCWSLAESRAPAAPKADAPPSLPSLPESTRLKRTYLIQVRLKIAISSALGSFEAFANDEYDDTDQDLYPDQAVEISDSGNTFLLAHTTKTRPDLVLEEIRQRFRALPLDAIGVLEIGGRSRVSEGEQAGSAETDDWWGEISVQDWLAGGRFDFDSRNAFGPKAFLIVTSGQRPETCRSVTALKRAFPQARPCWHGTSSLLLPFWSDHAVDYLWGHPIVTRAASDRDIAFLGCFEIGTAEAALDSLAKVLPSCERPSRNQSRAKPGLVPANDPLRSENDNDGRSRLRVSFGPGRRRY
jgi:hypothetical protein